VQSQKLRLLDLFSGIGGFSYAAEQIVGGFTTVQFVERDLYCQRILRKHWHNVPIHDDICTFQPRPKSADVIVGGFPCQDISVAGKQAGIKEGTRSGLFYQLMRVICLVRPKFIVLENVAAIIANGLDIVLGELSTAGFDAEWACIPASAVGACHQRDRWWLVAYPSSERCNGKEAEVFAGRDAIAGNDFANTTSEQRNVRQSANTKKQTRVAGESGDSNGTPAPNAYNFRSYGQNLSFPAMCRSDQGGEIELGVRCGVRTQRGSHWSARDQSLNPNWQSYVSKPVLCRGDDGLSNRVDRLKALGNAVVPQVAAIPLQRVLELDALWRAGFDQM